MVIIRPWGGESAAFSSEIRLLIAVTTSALKDEGSEREGSCRLARREMIGR